ncbi:MAG TPA: DUF4019 domain-containing protein [Thermoanaerobaculia bacterium]|nr:DUF4019 domain-containing protein [Thermoanaerobaculia bacterium]
MARRALTLGLVSLALAAGGRLPAADAPEKAGTASALAWLATVDAGRYAESWDDAAADFKAVVSRTQWVAALDKARKPLGKVVSRQLREAKYLTEVPGGPVGEYVAILYDTSFENAPGRTETATPMKDKDGVWRVSGYYIK